jgi:hypothetical protein
MGLLGDLHRAYDGPPPEAARLAAGLGGLDRWTEIADRRRALSCESMLRSVAALQPSLVSLVNTQTELRRGTCLPRRRDRTQSALIRRGGRAGGCQVFIRRYAADISQNEANVARAGSKDKP